MTQTTAKEKFGHQKFHCLVSFFFLEIHHLNASNEVGANLNGADSKLSTKVLTNKKLYKLDCFYNLLVTACAQK